jgi:hypothetical protein
VKEACDLQEFDEQGHNELADAIHKVIVDAFSQCPRLRGVPRIEIELATADARNKIAQILRGHSM